MAGECLTLLYDCQEINGKAKKLFDQGGANKAGLKR